MRQDKKEEEMETNKIKQKILEHTQNILHLSNLIEALAEQEKNHVRLKNILLKELKLNNQK
jgi:hypothetical protein